MKIYNKPKLKKYGWLRNLTFSRESDSLPKKSILRPFSDYVRESEEHAKQEKENQ